MLGVAEPRAPAPSPQPMCTFTSRLFVLNCLRIRAQATRLKIVARKVETTLRRASIQASRAAAYTVLNAVGVVKTCRACGLAVKCMRASWL